MFGLFSLAGKKEVKKALLTFHHRLGTTRIFEVHGVAHYELSALLAPAQRFLDQYLIDFEA